MLRALVLSFTSMALIALDGPQALADTVRIWKIGSPYRGDTPTPTIPLSLKEAARELGAGISVETLPAKGFATTFARRFT